MTKKSLPLHRFDNNKKTAVPGRFSFAATKVAAVSSESSIKKIFISQRSSLNRKEIRKAYKDYTITTRLSDADCAVTNQIVNNNKIVLTDLFNRGWNQTYLSSRLYIDKKTKQIKVIKNLWGQAYSKEIEKYSLLINYKVVNQPIYETKLPKFYITESDFAKGINLTHDKIDIKKIVKMIHAKDKNSFKLAAKSLMLADPSKFLLYQLYFVHFSPNCKTQTKRTGPYNNFLIKYKKEIRESNPEHWNKNYIVLDNIINYAKDKSIPYEEFAENIIPHALVQELSNFDFVLKKQDVAEGFLL